jgi:hypothetical protein
MNLKIKSLISALVFTGFASMLGAQNVGIGTTSVTRAKLVLNGMVGNTTAIFGSGANGIGLISSWPGIDFNAYVNGSHRYINNGYAMVQSLNPDNGYMTFQAYGSGSKDASLTGGRSAITIAANGRVGIGDNPGFNAQLSVGRDADKNGSAYFAAPQFSTFNYGAAEHTTLYGSPQLGINYYAQNSKIAFGVDGSMVGVNWSIPVYPLEVHSPDFSIGLMRIGHYNQWLMTVNNNFLKLYFRVNGDNPQATFQRGQFSYTNGVYTASSDRRGKKQIEPLPPMLEKIMQLQAYYYKMKYNNPNQEQTFGLMAQEVKEIFPALVHVTQNANTGYKDITDVHLLQYSGLAPMIMKALQEQRTQLSQLEEQTARMEKR